MPKPPPMQHTITLETAVAGFLTDRRGSVSANTIRCYRDELHQLILYAGNVEIGEITPALLRQFFEKLGEKRNQGGVHSVYRVVHAFCNWLALEYDNWVNPMPRVKVASPEVRALPGIALDKIKHMVNVCNLPMGGILGQRDSAIIRVLYDTGIRAFELRGINIQDVNLTDGSIIIRGKGGRDRVVYIETSTRRVLRKYMRLRLPAPTDPLFTTVYGNRITKRGLEQVIAKIAHRAGVYPVPGLHDFRRAFALAMHRAGVDILSISRLMGHQSPTVTARYIAAFDEDLRAAHAKGSPGELL